MTETGQFAPAATPDRIDRTSPPVIRAERVWKVFGPHPERLVDSEDALLPRRELRRKTGCVVAVRNVSLEVWPGEVFVVMGLSGSGKSTLVRALIRLIEPTAGRIEIAGRDVMKADRSELRELRRHSVSMVFQNFGLLAHRRVIDNVAFGLEVRGMSKRERHARAHEVLKLVGLEDAADQFPDQLSGGMQQRVGVARAFAVDPDVMLYDEPFSALDPLIRRDMQDEICRLQVETGKTELVGSPADEYVENFTRDIPRSQVLTLRWIMREPEPGEETDGPKLDVRTTMRNAVSVLIASDKPVRAMENGRVVGIVDRAAVLEAIAQEGPG
jgi:glycine betaine/proline transport system ATP-binding protein